MLYSSRAVRHAADGRMANGVRLYFHVTAAPADPASAHAFEAAGPYWRELVDERVITHCWRRADGLGLFLIVEAGDGGEAERLLTRLPWVLDGTVTMSLLGVEPL